MMTETAAPLAAPIPIEPRPEVGPGSWVALGARASAFATLTKPRIAVLVLLTVAVGYLLGRRSGVVGPASWTAPLLALLGTGLVAGGASAWNQVLERSRDARMRRTRTRPLPRGAVSPAEAGWFGGVLALVGLVLLAMGPHPIAAVVALATFVLYAFVYTPLKPVTTLNTAVGAIPGALPPVIGWTASTGRFGVEAWTLFLVVFLWQFPHFLAIAWLHREDYARGGHRMLPSVDPSGALTGRQATLYALTLVPAGLLPAVVGVAGPTYFFGALGLGLFYLASAARFWFHVGDASARRLLRASFVYLPALLLLLVLCPSPV